jgi:phage head maturation protease
MFQPQFDLEDSFAKEIYRKYKDGFLNAFSVGFIPLEAEENTYTKSELLEISAVPIPANPNAIVSLSKSGMKSVEWKDLVDAEIQEAEVEEEVAEEDAEERKEIITDYETWKAELDEDYKERFIKEIERDAEKTAFEKVAEDIKEISKEIKDSKKPKKVEDAGLKEIADFMRILNQATAIGLKKVKEIKG